MRANAPPGTCVILGCGRPSYARRMCQTHHRQLLTTGRTKEIRPYRPRTPDTVKFAGLRLTPKCAAKIARFAKATRRSHGAAIAALLEDWLANGLKNRASCDS